MRPEGLSTAVPISFTITNLILITGNTQFEINGAVFGEETFPTGVLTGATDNIPVI